MIPTATKMKATQIKVLVQRAMKAIQSMMEVQRSIMILKQPMQKAKIQLSSMTPLVILATETVPTSLA